MIITDIIPIKKGRYRIIIDDSPAFVLYSGELRSYGLSSGTEISGDVYREIVDTVLVKRARLRAMNLLMKHSFTEMKLREKLAEGDYPQEIIDNALEYVKSFGYINDEKYAEDYIFSHRGDKSRNRIINDLLAKGIERDTVRNALENTEKAGDTVNEEEQIRKLLMRKHYDPAAAEYDERMKMCAFLMRKGFSTETIRKCMSSLDITSE